MSNWQDVLRNSTDGDHVVQVYQDREFLASAVAEYIGTGLKKGDAAIVIARPDHAQAFKAALQRFGVNVEDVLARRQLLLFDAQATLDRFMQKGMPQWTAFHQVVGGAIAEVRLQYPVVRAYGEMVDILWQGGERDAAIRLEEFWNDLAKLQTFSLFCAYYLDNLDERAYGGPLECVCKVHSHLIPAQDYQRFDDTVTKATEKVLDPLLMRMLLSMSSAQKPPTQMPLGQAMLLWMQANMPATARKVLTELRAAEA
ncbi:MAG: hypothetical protein QOD26_1016 [Betaproteobacteria bacterium]|jgi:hypothetical protein|nr:hypothetical protein [Betaproteobacteria bacterium]